MKCKICKSNLSDKICINYLNLKNMNIFLQSRIMPLNIKKILTQMFGSSLKTKLSTIW